MEAQDGRSVHSNLTPTRGALTGLRVIELADEQAEYCGLALAGLGADVVKVEPPGGTPRGLLQAGDPARSLLGGVQPWQARAVLDLQPGRDQCRALIATADVLLESTPRGELDGLGLGADTRMQ
jgi:crotonobetainyl-CoA:carnitine CoA-transferase CaiB-like acyl-CoA transferase